jgi:L-ribulose-5-phosphate 4-epimerase
MMDEGVIRFQCHWQPGGLPPSVDVLPLLRTRNHLHHLGLIGHDTGADVGYGNISGRAGTGNSFLVSGTQTGHIPMLTANGLSYVTHADIATNTLHCTGPAKASSESLTHAAVYRQFAAVTAVIHVHHRRLWQQLMHRVPTTLPTIGYGTTAMAGEIARLTAVSDLANQKIMVMSGHQDGLIVFGESMAAAEARLLHWFNANNG